MQCMLGGGGGVRGGGQIESERLKHKNEFMQGGEG